METKQRQQRPQMTLRHEMDDQLERLSDASGLPKVEIMARALNEYEPRLLRAIEVLQPTHNQPAAEMSGAA